MVIVSLAKQEKAYLASLVYNNIQRDLESPFMPLKKAVYEKLAGKPFKTNSSKKKK